MQNQVLDKSRIAEDHHCSICLDVYYKPVRLTKCGHLFCNSCLNEAAVVGNDRRCPLCRDIFTVKQLRSQIQLWIQMQRLYPAELQKKKKSMQERVMVRFIIGNTTKVLATEEDNKYEWELFVRSMQGERPLSDFADLVEVYLHPTFQPRKLKYHLKEGRDITLRRIGWGTFEIGVRVFWKKEYNEKSSQFIHHLQFSSLNQREMHAIITPKK